MATHPNVPQEMRWIEKKCEFSIRWEDGHQSIFPLLFLRRQCPCALCRDEKSHPNPLSMTKLEAKDLKALSIEPLGHYALKIHWSDGHASGIYAFDFLRILCPCPQCTKEIP